jgi:iron complex outermembrane receptor protein
VNILKPLAVILSITLCTEAYAQIGFDDELLFDPTIGEVPHVLSAVRLHQPTAEVPASVTVLDAQFIKATGAKNIQDLFRYVPGMLVTPEVFDNSDSVAYHGGPMLYPKSMEVLIDGRAAYRSGLSAVGWNQLPVAVEEIQRIEVVRGPNSTTYGTNAFQAVVNIITKHPLDTISGRSVNIQLGDNNDHYLHANSGFDFAGGQWHLTAVDKGTDHLQDSNNIDRLGCTSSCSDRRDTSFINLRSYHELDDTQSLDTTIVVSTSKRPIPDYELDDNQVADKSLEAGLRYFNDISSNHHLKISTSTYRYTRKQAQRAASIPSGLLDPLLVELYLLNPTVGSQIANGQAPDALDYSNPKQLELAQALAVRYADPADFLTPLSGASYPQTTEHRLDVEVQDTYAITPDLTLLSGIGYRFDKVASETYYAGVISNNSLRLFGNINWRMNSKWALHAGFMNENSNLNDSALSLRAAANYLISPVQSVRLVYSSASKTPDFLESHAQWFYKIEDIETESPYSGEYFYRSLVLDQPLKSQHINSYEFGYYGQSLTHSHEWDVRLFYEQITDLIFLWPTIRSTKLYPDNSVDFYGIEWQYQKNFTTRSSLRYIGAYTEANSKVEEGLTEEELLAIYSPLSQTLSLQVPLNSSVNSMVSLFWVKDFGGPSENSEAYDIQRLDINVFGSLQSRSLEDISWAVSLQHDLSKSPYIAGASPYEQSTRFQLELGLNF